MSRINFRKACIGVLVSSFIIFSSTSAIAGPIIIKLGWTTAAGETDPYAITARQFKKALDAEAPGQFEVQFFPSQQLGDEKEMLEGLSFGTLDAGVITNSPISRIALPFQINDMPFIYANKEQAYKVLDGPNGQRLMKILGQKILSASALLKGATAR
jgi:TRAP-type C4-dicarboxylate transport system substrate-binding protein